MKFLLVCFILFSFSGCNNLKQKPVDENQQQVEIRDSNILKRQQPNPYAAVDVSPMDIAYSPADYPILKMSGKTSDLPVARIIYSRPHRQGRVIFGGLLKYGEPWRLGANEATEIEFFKPVTILGNRVQAGRYILYCIPHQKSWTIIFNSNLYSWGLRNDGSKDLFKFEIPVSSTPVILEYFTMVFKETSAGADLIIAWENVEARIPIQF